MLLESITLENFRQFRHESIDFAQGDNGKNVTIIIGENGTVVDSYRHYSLNLIPIPQFSAPFPGYYIVLVCWKIHAE